MSDSNPRKGMFSSQYQSTPRNRQSSFSRGTSSPTPGPSSSSLYTPPQFNVENSRRNNLGLNAPIGMLATSTPSHTPPSSMDRWSNSTTNGRNRMSMPSYEKVFRPRASVEDYMSSESRENYELTYFANASNISFSSLASQDMQQQARQLASGRKDLSNYPPCQKFKLEDPGTRIHSVGNEVTGETVIAVTSTKHVVIYLIKLKEKEKTQGSKSNLKSDVEEKFELIKIHQLNLINEDMSEFCLSSLVSVTLPPLKLLYALAPKMSTSIYFYNQMNRDTIPADMKVDDKVDGQELSMLQKISNNYPVTKMALDGEKEYLACVLSNRTVVVWDLPTRTKFVTFALGSHGVHIEWHKSEPYRLMVVEGKGYVKFYNVYKQTCFMSINAGRTPLYSADWANSNSLLTTIGWSGGFTVINCSQMNSNMYKTFEIPQVNVSKVKFNPADDMVLATLGRTPGIIRLWRQNFSSHIWSHKNKVDDIAWVHGQPYLIALGYRSLYFYEASVL